MLRRRRFLHAVFRLADLFAMVLAFTTATYLEHFREQGLTALQMFGMRIKLVNFVAFLAFMLVWHLCLKVFGLYRSRRLSSRFDEMLDVGKATMLGTLLVFNLGLVMDITLFSGGFVARFALLSILLTIATRMVLRSLLEQARRQGHNLRQVLLVGTNDRAFEYAAKLQARPELGYRVMGFVDNEWSGVEKLERQGGRVVSDFQGLAGYLRDNVVDEVVLALPIGSCYSESSQVVRLCEKQGIRVRLLSNFFDLTLAQAELDMFQGEPVLMLQSGPAEGVAIKVKRLFDLVAALVLLIFLAPLFAAIAIAIKLTSPGPVFFTQERVGFAKRRFKIFKFRTMVQDAERRLSELEHLNEVSGPVFKIREDPRITAIGSFLRRTSLDELPQLLSVIKGDMSLVGPRPLPVRDYEGFAHDWHRRRFSVRPGVTCLWQVEGRNSIPFERWMELDMQYIDSWSLWLDLRILLRTIPAVLRGTGV